MLTVFGVLRGVMRLHDDVQTNVRLYDTCDLRTHQIAWRPQTAFSETHTAEIGMSRGAV